MSDTVAEEAAIDEALRESFPASDAPAWTGVHAGEPARPKPPHKADVVGTLREDIGELRGDPRRIEERFRALGIPVKRRPEDSVNVEAVVLGTKTPNQNVVVVAGIDRASDVAALLMLARTLVAAPLARTVRLVALGSTVRYVDELVRSGARVDAALALERLGCGTRLVSVRPGWPLALVQPGSRTCHHLAFARRGIRALMLTDVGRERACDYERLGETTHRLVEIVNKLGAQ